MSTTDLDRFEPRVGEEFRPGYFLARLVRGGPMLPARIWRPCVCTVGGENEHPWQASCDRNPPMQAEINGRPADIWRVWNSRDEITEAEFRYLTDTAAWDRANDPDAPAANPNKPVNLRELDPIF